MSDDLIIQLRQSVKYIELAAAITGFLFWPRWKNSFVKYLIIYLLIISLAEFFGNYLGRIELFNFKNLWYKYFVLPFEIVFCFWFVNRALNRKLTVRINIVLFSIYLAGFLFDAFLLDKAELPFSSVSYSVGNIILLIMILMYYRMLLNSDQLLTFYLQPVFWIISGFLIFYLASFPYYLMFNFLIKHYYTEVYLPYHIIVVFLNYTMYSIFAFTFIWAKPR